MSAAQAPDELFGVAGNVLTGIAYAQGELAAGTQFDADGSYATLARDLTRDLDRVAARMHRWCRTHGVHDFLTRFDALTAHTPRPEETS